MRHLLLGAVIVAIGGGCPTAPRVQPAWQPTTPMPDVTPQPSATPTKRSEPKPSFHNRLLTIAELRDAVVAGNPTKARGLAALFAADLRQAQLPAGWAEHVAPVISEADALASTSDLERASTSVARLASTCGGCHDAIGVVPRLPEAPEPPRGTDLGGAMRQHQWSTDRMWEGLVVPSSDRWIRGTTLFAVLPGCRDVDVAGVDESADLCKRVQLLARRAHVQEGRQARTEAYGRLLATCAQCHDAARRPRSRDNH